MEWTSQAGGRARTKRGRVAARVFAGTPVPSALLVRGLSRIGAVVSRSDRYVVRVAGGGKGGGLLYSPYRSVVEHAMELREHGRKLGETLKYGFYDSVYYPSGTILTGGD